LFFIDINKVILAHLQLMMMLFFQLVYFTVNFLLVA
jgi:hypothetical protein